MQQLARYSSRAALAPVATLVVGRAMSDQPKTWKCWRCGYVNKWERRTCYRCS